MKQLIISVHGIRTFGGWQERLESLLMATNSDCDLSIENYKFGYFSVLAFIFPFFRWLTVRRFRNYLLHTTKRERWDRIDLVGHSFGTHLIAWALFGIPAEQRPQINTVILAGSVLKSNFPWQSLLGRGVGRVVNDCGIQDGVLLLNQITVLFTGMSGRLGFNGGTGRTFRNRFFDFGHSGYFLTNGMPDDSFMHRYWVPLLTTDAFPELVDVRKGGSLGGIKLVLLNNAEPIKLAIYMTPVIILALIYLGLYQTAETQRKIAIEQKIDAEKQRDAAESAAKLAMDAFLSEQVVKAAGDPNTQAAIEDYLKDNRAKMLQKLGINADDIEYRKYVLLKEVIKLDRSPLEMVVRARSDRFTLMYEALMAITALANKTGNSDFIRESDKLNSQYWDEVCQTPGSHRWHPPCSD